MKEMKRSCWMSVEYGSKKSRTVANMRAESIEEFTSKNPQEVWSAAAEFTRERLEEIRQLERDVDGVVRTVQNLGMELVKDGGETRIPTVRAYCSSCRILSRLQRDLDTPRKGMKNGGR